MSPSVVISVPASIANLGPGFDVFALALEEPRDVVRMSRSEEIKISDVSGCKGVPGDPKWNSVTLSAKKVFDLADAPGGFEVSIHKGIEIGKGLGSSGASAAGGAVVANVLLDEPLNTSDLIEAAGFAEEKTAGSAHYDNVAASILGGFVIVGSSRPLEYRSMSVPEMQIVIAVPEDTASTKRGREALPREIPLSDSVSNVGRASLMISALKDNDLESFARNMVDEIVEPIRAPRMPGVQGAKEAALDAGALGAAIAGAGPSVSAILEPDTDPGGVKKAMKEAFEIENQVCEVFVTHPGVGYRVEWEE